MPVGFSCHIFAADSQDLAEQVVLAMARAFQAVEEGIDSLSIGSHESRDSGMSKGSSRFSVPSAASAGVAVGGC